MSNLLLRKYTERDARYQVTLLFTLIALFHAGVRTVLYLFGEQQEFWFDAREYWFPVARRLSNGDILYLTAFDNKTPLWHGLNYLVYQTGYYGPIFYALVAVANAVVAYLLFIWVRRENSYKAGILAGTLYLVAVPLMNGDIINVRSFSLAFLLYAVVSDSPYRRGVSVAISVLFSQVAAVAVPILLLEGIRQSDYSWEWASQYIAAGAVTGVIPFIALGFIYNIDAMVAGVEASFIGAGDYFVARDDSSNPFVNPLTGIRNIVLGIQPLFFVLLPAAASALATQFHPNWEWNRVVGISLVLAGGFTITAFVKPLQYYWMPVVTFSAVLASVGIERWMK